MTLVVALLFGCGMLLVISPLLWPRTENDSPPLRRPPRFRQLREHIVRAGIPQLSPRILVAVSVLFAVVVASVTAALIPVTALAVAAGCAALGAPLVAVVLRGRARHRATRVVWPDVVDHLVSAARSGIALPDGVVALAHSGPPVTRRAFAEFEREYRASGNFTDSLDGLKNHLLDPVADRIIETLKMSREVGGNELPAVLRNLAVYLRQDAAIRSEIEGRQSWTVNAARLGIVAPWVVLLLLASRPEAAVAYNTPGGGLLIGAGAILSVLAYRLIMLIGKLPEEQRWFE
ncbi:MAG: type secretion system protein [Glaciihabitans sp.]|nr:type secretion system protein [Glaciihabitans sp.]